MNPMMWNLQDLPRRPWLPATNPFPGRLHHRMLQPIDFPGHGIPTVRRVIHDVGVAAAMATLAVAGANPDVAMWAVFESLRGPGGPANLRALDPHSPGPQALALSASPPKSQQTG